MMILSIQDLSLMLLGSLLVRGQPYVCFDDPFDTRSISPVKIRDPLDTRSQSHILQKTLSVQGLK